MGLFNLSEEKISTARGLYITVWVRVLSHIAYLYKGYTLSLHYQAVHKPDAEPHIPRRVEIARIPAVRVQLEWYHIASPHNLYITLLGRVRAGWGCEYIGL